MITHYPLVAVKYGLMKPFYRMKQFFRRLLGRKKSDTNDEDIELAKKEEVRSD
jgi:hypothetical protein